jgi:hypothetical protein
VTILNLVRFAAQIAPETHLTEDPVAAAMWHTTAFLAAVRFTMVSRPVTMVVLQADHSPLDGHTKTAQGPSFRLTIL